MRFAECGPARCDRGLDPRLIQSDHVGVALDDVGLAGSSESGLRAVEVVEHVALVVHGSLSCVEVLRLALDVFDETRPEPDGPARQVVDGERDAVAEPGEALGPAREDCVHYLRHRNLDRRSHGLVALR